MAEEETEHLRVETRRQIELDRRCCHQVCWDVCGCQKRHVQSVSMVFECLKYIMHCYYCSLRNRSPRGESQLVSLAECWLWLDNRDFCFKSIHETIVSHFTLVFCQVIGLVFLFPLPNLLLWTFQIKSVSPLHVFPMDSFIREMSTGYFLSWLDQFTCCSHHAEWPHSGAPWSYVAWLTTALDSCAVSHRRISGCCGLVRGELPHW